VPLFVEPQIRLQLTPILPNPQSSKLSKPSKTPSSLKLRKPKPKRFSSHHHPKPRKKLIYELDAPLLSPSNFAVVHRGVYIRNFWT
jgi:hypothetical protein